jgi:very-short-patch-repair endonuclease/predicted transcriptional regulator of viral defense system
MSHPYDVHHDYRGQGHALGRDAPIARLAGCQHGVVSRAQLAALGLEPHMVDYRVMVGRLHAVHRGVYAVGHRALTRDGMFMAATLVADGAVLSHRSAAALLGMRPADRSVVDITVGRQLRHRDRVVIHRAHLPPDEVTTRHGILVTSPARTLLDLAPLISPQELERAATEAEVQRLGSRTSLAALVARYPKRSGTAEIRRLLRDGQIGRNVTKRELELRFLTFLDAAKLPRPRINARVELPLDRPEVDCLWAEHRLVVELDGFDTHRTRRSFEADRARDRTLQVAGYRVVRVTWRHLTEESRLLAAQFRALLTTGLR